MGVVMGVVEAMVDVVGINKIKGGKNPFTLVALL